jgi:cytochrome c
VNAAALLMVATAALVGAWGAAPRHAQAAAPVPAARLPAGNPVAGRMLYQACSGCHSLDENDVGPKHRGVVGRKAGAVADYAYSAVIRKSGIVWTPANLDRWLTNPQKLVPGSKMYFSVANPKQRADIIAYLAQQH